MNNHIIVFQLKRIADGTNILWIFLLVRSRVHHVFVCQGRRQTPLPKSHQSGESVYAIRQIPVGIDCANYCFHTLIEHGLSTVHQYIQ